MKIEVYGNLLKHSRPPCDDLVVNIQVCYKKKSHLLFATVATNLKTEKKGKST